MLNCDKNKYVKTCLSLFSDEYLTLKREIVLLTSDMNLRVKAHLRNVPTKTIENFMNWSKLKT